jgi:hypothetical protein
LFLLTLIFTVFSLLWFWVETPFKGKKVCNESYALNSPFSTSNQPESIFGGQVACEISPPKDLSSTHSAFINLATISGIAFLIASGYAYASRKKQNPPERGELD